MKIIGKFVLRIIFFLSVISSLIYFHFETLYGFFLTNQTLNTLILSVILIGIIFILRQIFLIESEVKWLNNLLKTQKGLKISVKSPSLLKYLDNFLKKNTGKVIFSQSSLKTIMESLEGRIVESREISKYTIGLTIFLGLLGTFWGLLETINSVGATVSNLDFSENTQKLFKVLKQGLEDPLNGMGTAILSTSKGVLSGKKARELKVGGEVLCHVW